MRDIINNILKQYHSELISEIDKAETLLKIKRIYDAGQVLEIALRSLFKRILPEFVGVTRGIVIDSNVVEKSEEIDLIIYDKRYFSGFEINDNLSDTISVISIDTVFGIISVKKKLTLSSLEDSIKNINSVYKLNRRRIHNQFHFDLDLGRGLNYKNGLELNKIFSCIITYENDLFFKIEKGKKVKKNSKEISNYFKKIAKEGKFNGSHADLIYSISGSLIYPIIFHSETQVWLRDFSTLNLGSEKLVFQSDTTNEKLISKQLLAYTINENEPYTIMGQFIMHIQVYVKQLIKSSPNLQEIFKGFFDTNQFNIIGKEKADKGGL